MSSKRPSLGIGNDVPRRKKGKRIEIDKIRQAEDKRAGTIEKILMKNFMCHSLMEVNLNKNINFIVGRNGSGKSAILSAVVVALGCKASVTNRASSLRDFVKQGSRSSIVEVTLSNIGSLAYKPELYGQRIIISRTLYSNATPPHFKIKSEKGEVISTKRDDLNHIIQNFNIQVDNPVTVLNQDSARTFLAAADPKTKYAIFMKATRLEDVNSLHATTVAAEEWSQKKLQKFQNNVKESEKEVKELEKKWQHLQKLNNCRERIRQIENEFFWAMAAEEEKALSLLENDTSKEEETIRMNQIREQKFGSELTEKVNEIRTMKEDLDSKSSNIHALREQIDVAKEKERTKRHEYSSKLREYKDVKAKAEQHEADLLTVKEEIDKMRENSSSQGAAQRKLREQQLAVLMKEQGEIAAILQTNNHLYRQLRGEAIHFRDSLTELRSKHAALKSSIGRRRSEITNLKQDKDNLALYGRWMPQLVRRIDEAYQRKKFVRKPLGPIGSFLKLSDKEWAHAVEHELGQGMLRSFFCHCSEDVKVLKQLMNEVIRSGNYPGIIMSRFQDKVYDIQNTMVRAPGYQNLFEVLEISNPNIANCLIDNKSIECVLLVPSHAEAAKMMSDDRMVPKFCKRCITLAGDVYYPYPDYKTYGNNSKVRNNLLQTSAQEAINNLEEQIVSEQQNMSGIEQQIKEVNQKVDTNKKEYKTIELKLKKLQEKKADVDLQINDLKKSVDTQSGNFQALAQEMNELEINLAQINNEESALDEAAKIKKKGMEDAKRDLERLQENLVTEEAARKETYLRLNEIKEDVKRLEMRKKEAQLAYEHLDKKVKAAKLKYNLQKEKTEKALNDAQRFHAERIETDRSLSEIKKDLNECKSYVRSAEQQTGSALDVTKQLIEKKKAHSLHVKNLTSMRRALEKFHDTLCSRKSLYCLVKKIMALKVTYMFQPLLEQRGYQGAMYFEHERRLLNIEVSPVLENEARETKSLSGGERSYSTVAFILSLWECVDPPFYFLDEFDVFMDKVNRRVIMDLLLYQAKQKNQFQYVFLTPQDTSSVNGDKDVTIHQLEDPERSYV